VPYLLDTNILSQVVRAPQGPISSRIRESGELNVFTSIIVAAELRFGASKFGSAKLSASVEEVLDGISVEPLTVPSDKRYAVLRAHLERVGTPIGNNDMLIAAHALATNSILVTDNVMEFSRIPGLKIENWLRERPQSSKA
jgi:tRNA(fMet)-specific endonuclease VapC